MLNFILPCRQKWLKSRGKKDDSELMIIQIKLKDEAKTHLGNAVTTFPLQIVEIR